MTISPTRGSFTGDEGELVARHYATGAPARLAWAAGRVHTLGPAARPASPNLWLAPALTDPQINGFAGVDFQQDHLSVDALLSAVALVVRQSSTYWPCEPIIDLFISQRITDR